MNIDEEKLALEVTKGMTGFFERIVAPDVKAIIAILNSHTELLKEHSQKLDKLTEGIHQLDLKQTEILAKLDLEKRVRALEEKISHSPKVGKGEGKPKRKYSIFEPALAANWSNIIAREPLALKISEWETETPYIVKAQIARNAEELPEGDELWIESKEGKWLSDEPWAIKIIEEYSLDEPRAIKIIEEYSLDEVPEAPPHIKFKE
jgi:hypothetical protein